MRPDSQLNRKDTEQIQHGKFNLLVIEQVGSRRYLRSTRLALMLIVGLMFISIIMIIVHFLLQGNPMKTTNTDVNITVPSSNAQSPDIRPAAPAPSPPAVRSVKRK
jgi:cellobiose-specific phosphotransferase system component IIC